MILNLCVKYLYKIESEDGAFETIVPKWSIIYRNVLMYLISYLDQTDDKRVDLFLLFCYPNKKKSILHPLLNVKRRKDVALHFHH